MPRGEFLFVYSRFRSYEPWYNYICLFIGRGGVGERVIGSVSVRLILIHESIFIYLIHFFGKI